jgi:hypothetical protein
MAAMDLSRLMHVSIGALVEMQAGAEYDLYRVYELDEYTAKLRVAKSLKPFADSVLAGLSSRRAA